MGPKSELKTGTHSLVKACFYSLIASTRIFLKLFFVKKVGRVACGKCGKKLNGSRGNLGVFQQQFLHSVLLIIILFLITGSPIMI